MFLFVFYESMIMSLFCLFVFLLNMCFAVCLFPESLRFYQNHSCFNVKLVVHSVHSLVGFVSQYVSFFY